MTIPFAKMHGIGNDFVVVDGVRAHYDGASWQEIAQLICDRRFGVGSDGLILIEKPCPELFQMRMWNPDGSESEMCGNGIRCVARYIANEGLSRESTIPIETGAGRLQLELLSNGEVRVDMGYARLNPLDIGIEGFNGETFIDQAVSAANQVFRGTAVSMGNPHLVIFVEDVAQVPLETWGPALEVQPLFRSRTNVHFVQVKDREHLIQRTWERGAGPTLACGTGACACGVAAFLNGLAERDAEVRLPGGYLHVSYKEDGRVFMTGPARTVFTGTWSH
ncbi:MAG: Diaminopimelate epimerase [Fimbriimonadaceae bacterium]|nr:Diaminopimelate epimerase [Fimbriimonadaceae bacterium]